MSRTYLRRYTNLPALIYMLSNRVITLLDPATWTDTNDSYFVRLYQEKMEYSSVLALCFSQTEETFHHWRVFADGSSGVCVRFRRQALLRAMRKKNVRTGKVRYLTLDDIRGVKLKAKDLPFLKRAAFEHEDEHRAIYDSKFEAIKSLDIPIPLSSIERITLSPWISFALSKPIKKFLKEIPGCGSLEIVRSTLIGNQEWKRLGEGAAK